MQPAGEQASQGARCTCGQAGNPGVVAGNDQYGSDRAAQGEAAVSCQIRKIQHAKRNPDPQRNQRKDQADFHRTHE